jgi:magnesium chelatase subunit D
MKVFPFSAVLGQERLKLALLLSAIDPGVGGVLVRGPRGVAKTTLARACSELLPGRFVELPLGATEERVTGSLDLGKALGQGEVEFAPGLLARAHDGVLYVDEVNLLPDALVDLLLDAAATGQNVVERDGVSHVHAARFVLIGTMNPEEGELRPQLCDRFGLSVAADDMLGPAERTEVVLRRLEFERDPERFIATFAEQQRALLERCGAARRRVQTLPFAGAGVARASELCHAAGVDGVRADLAMLRAARAHAAWHSQNEILPSDVDAVAELALAHRRRGPEPGAGGRSGGGEHGGDGRSGAGRSASSGGSRSGLQAQGRGPGGSASRAAHDNSGSDRSEGDASGESRAADDGNRSVDARADHARERGARDADPDGLQTSQSRGALRPIPVRSGPPPLLPGWFIDASATSKRPRAAGAGRRARGAEPEPRSATRRRRRGAHAVRDGAIDWVEALLGVARNRQLAPESRPRLDLRRRPRRLARGGHWVLALDCSASMLQSGALGAAKGVASALARRAPSASARLVLLSFGGGDVRVPTALESGRASIERAIAALGAAGATPLRRAVQIGLETASRAAPGALDRRLLLFTDGRTRERVDDLAALRRGVEVTVIDCERGAVRLGRARRVAAALEARYVHIDWIAEGVPARASAAGSRDTNAVATEPVGPRRSPVPGARR